MAGVALAAALTVAAPEGALALEEGVQVVPIPDADVRRLAEGGADVLRLPVVMDVIRPDPAAPGDWSGIDAVVLAAARSGTSVLPVLRGDVPAGFDDPEEPPLAPDERARFASFLQEAVRRYGPAGTLWAAHPDVIPVPITDWQVWNEPSLPKHWRGRPRAREYARVLRYAREAILAVDPGARIVLAGMPQHHQEDPASEYLEELYEVRGVKRLFDAAAVHSYSRRPKGAVSSVRHLRRVMDRAGDEGKPILITELAWSSGGPDRHPTVTTLEGQASRLRKAFRLLGRAAGRLELETVIWHAWRDTHQPPGVRDRFWFHSGLFDVDGFPKPAWDAFADVAGGQPGTGPLTGPPL